MLVTAAVTPCTGTVQKTLSVRSGAINVMPGLNDLSGVDQLQQGNCRGCRMKSLVDLSRLRFLEVEYCSAWTNSCK